MIAPGGGDGATSRRHTVIMASPLALGMSGLSGGASKRHWELPMSIQIASPRHPEDFCVSAKLPWDTWEKSLLMAFSEAMVASLRPTKSWGRAVAIGSAFAMIITPCFGVAQEGIRGLLMPDRPLAVIAIRLRISTLLQSFVEGCVTYS